MEVLFPWLCAAVGRECRDFRLLGADVEGMEGRVVVVDGISALWYLLGCGDVAVVGMSAK